MISNPRLLYYYCIAKGRVILAEHSSKEDAGMEEIALRCIENIPPHHSMISHTVRNTTYSLIIDGFFSYFAILDELVHKSKSLYLFTRLKSATEALIADGSSLDNPIHLCLQSKLDPIFAEISGGGDNKDLELEVDIVGSPRSVTRESKSLLESSRGRKGSLMPFLGRVLKNKKRLQTEAKSEGMEKKMGLRNGLIHDHHKQKAKQIWRKHVWLVLIFDLCVCALLFGIWLWVCQGYQCFDANHSSSSNLFRFS